MDLGMETTSGKSTLSADSLEDNPSTTIIKNDSSGKKPRRKPKAQFMREISKKEHFFGPFEKKNNWNENIRYKAQLMILNASTSSFEDLARKQTRRIDQLASYYYDFVRTGCTYIDPMKIIKSYFADARCNWTRGSYFLNELLFDNVVKYPHIEIAFARFPMVFSDKELESMDKNPAFRAEWKPQLKNPLLHNISASFEYGCFKHCGFYIVFKPKEGDKNFQQGFFMPLMKGDPRVADKHKDCDGLAYRVSYHNKPRRTELFEAHYSPPNTYRADNFIQDLGWSIRKIGSVRK